MLSLAGARASWVHLNHKVIDSQSYIEDLAQNQPWFAAISDVQNENIFLQ